MSDMKLTNEKMQTFTGHEKVGTFKAGEKLMEFGENRTPPTKPSPQTLTTLSRESALWRTNSSRMRTSCAA